MLYAQHASTCLIKKCKGNDEGNGKGRARLDSSHRPTADRRQQTTDMYQQPAGSRKETLTSMR
jgi:hypothetical protein